MSDPLGDLRRDRRDLDAADERLRTAALACARLREHSLAEVAAAAGVSTETLRRWRRDADQ